jgi:type I restriction enzyme M protein
LFKPFDFSTVDFDIRNTALQEYLTPEIRKGLGIFLTPNDVVRMMVEYVNPKSATKVLDPACGSGTFLMEVIRHAHRNGYRANKIFGIDKNPRMLLLSELNLGHIDSITYYLSNDDSLFPSSDNRIASYDSYDLIFTNPPFGVVIDNANYPLRNFQTCRYGNGRVMARQCSEIMFVEQCLSYLRPGGILSIVLPKSVISNSTLKQARLALDRIGYIQTIVLLPPETFMAAGTQTSTVVLFIKKFDLFEDTEELVTVRVADVKSVGYDSTGRPVEANDLIDLPKILSSKSIDGSYGEICYDTRPIPKSKTFSTLNETIARGDRSPSERHLRLAALTETITTGKTPPRNWYEESGAFILKVGNLSGNGISWAPRDRNFVNEKWVQSRNKSSTVSEIMLNDILLTSSAHSSVYIAKKVDIVDWIPDWLATKVYFVGELMLLRCLPYIDPYLMVAYLRLPSVSSQILKMVRGQTAHLYADDLKDLPIDTKIFYSDELREISLLVRQESELNRKLNINNYYQSLLKNSPLTTI